MIGELLFILLPLVVGCISVQNYEQREKALSYKGKYHLSYGQLVFQLGHTPKSINPTPAICSLAVISAQRSSRSSLLLYSLSPHFPLPSTVSDIAATLANTTATRTKHNATINRIPRFR